MKKSIIWLFLPAIIFVSGCVLYGCTEKTEVLKGSIYGTVTDFQTKEPIGGVNVKLKPSGEATLTGSDGSFVFKDLDAENYTLSFSKAEYEDLDDDYIIELKAGKKVKRDVQMRKKVASLQITDMMGAPLSELDFGAEASVTSKSFNIFNNGTQNISCVINNSCNWITSVTNPPNPIIPSQTVTIIVTIDRSRLLNGVNSTYLQVVSENGSNQILVKATGLSRPMVTTTSVTGVSQNSATFNGTIEDAGTPPYTERGFVYSTSPQPTVDNNLGKITAATNNQNSFTATVSNLTANTTYYVRAYAINTAGDAYGNDMTFTTNGSQTIVSTSGATNISSTSATLNGTIINAGSPAYTEKGFCYSTNPDPTISNNKVIVSGSGEGAYFRSIDNLAYQTTYYVKAYAIQKGQPVYGAEVNFTTVWVDAQVQTSAVSNITTTSAKFNGSVLNGGTPAYSERGFCYSTTNSDPTINSSRVIVSGSGSTGNFYKNMTGLTEGETYYVKAYVIQNGTPIYGSTVTFSTDELPVVYTSDVSNLTPVSSAGIILSWNVTFNGSIGSVGSPAYVERGFCYGTSMNPTGNRQVVSGSGVTGSFNKSISGLNNYQTYYVRAYAKTASGTYVYGQNISFSTYDW